MLNIINRNETLVVLERFKTRQTVFSSMDLWIEVYSETTYINQGDIVLIKVYSLANDDSIYQELPAEKMIWVGEMTIERPVNVAKEAHQVVFKKIIELLYADYQKQGA